MEFFRLNSQYCKHPRHKFHTWDLLTHCRPKFLAYYRQMLLSSPFAVRVYVQYKCIGMKICLFLLKKTKEDNLTHESIKSMNIYCTSAFHLLCHTCFIRACYKSRWFGWALIFIIPAICTTPRVNLLHL